MPRWIPEQLWKDQEVFIIGGGTSLKTFNWDLLINERTIGCNDAFKLGNKVCEICVFGDTKWFERHQHDLAKFKGAVFTNQNTLYKTRLPWLYWMQREPTGFHKASLGWNDNTGAVAINLALILGAKKIYLLGFDMKLDPTQGKYRQANWHENHVDNPDPEIYDKFNTAFRKLPASLEKNFPGVEVINVTDDSDLVVFPKVSAKKFWKERALRCVA
jgi:hypothetical protein